MEFHRQYQTEDLLRIQVSMESPEVLQDYTSLSAQDVGYSIQQLHEDVEPLHIEQVPEDVEPFLTQEIPINVEASPDVIPKVGMRFNTEEEIYGFVNQYAYQVGFGISKASVRNEGDRKYYKLRCGKGGVHVAKPESTRTKLSRKTGCKAKVNVIVHGDGRCIISRVFLEHNHILSPKKSRCERSHKEINAYTKGRLELNDYAGIPLNKNFHSFAVEAKEMSSARCSNELDDDEVRAAKKLKAVLVDDRQTKTDEQLVELISMNKRNAGLLELVLPNKAQALKEAVKSYEDELHRRTNLSHSPKKTSPQLDNRKLVIKVEVGDQENSSDALFIPEEERAESREKIGTNVVEPPKVPDFSTQQTVKVNIPKEPKQKQNGRKLWVEAEETLLAMAFIHTPEEYVVVGSSQQSNMCWNRFLSYFNQNNTSGIRRNEDQIRSKWRNMNIKIATFNAIFTKVMSKCKNGCSDDDINICARQTYKKEVGKHFTLDHVWNLLKDSPKWKSRFVVDQKTSKSTKPFAKEQTHTSSSSSEDDDDDDDGDGSINLEDDEPKLERPSSNKTPKRVEKSKASSSSTSSKVYEAFLQRGQMKDDNFLQLKETLDLRNKLRQEKLKMDAEKIQIQAEKLKNENIAFLLQDASSLTGIDRDIILRRKEEIRNKYSN